MTDDEFDQLLIHTRMHPDGDATRGARMVLVEGATQNQAARELGRQVSTVHQAVARLRKVALATGVHTD